MPGVYAIKVSGQLPDEIRSSLEDEYRIQYIPYVDAWHIIGEEGRTDLDATGEMAHRPRPMLDAQGYLQNNMAYNRGEYGVWEIESKILGGPRGN